MQIELKQLINMYEQALVTKSDNVLVPLKLADLYYSQGNLEDAWKACQKALKLQPDLENRNKVVQRVLLNQKKWKNFELNKFNIIEIDSKSLFEYPDAIKQIYNYEIDGLIVKQAFSNQEMLNVKNNLEQAEYSNTYSWFGSAIDMHTAKKISKSQRLNLDVVIKQFIKNLNDIFTDKCTTKINNILNQISTTIPVASIEAHRQGFLNIPASFKVLHPGKGGFSSHTDNEYFEVTPDYDKLKPNLDLPSVLSYFVVINKAEQGGELVLHHLLQEETPSELYEKPYVNSIPEDTSKELARIPYLSVLRDAYLERFPQECVQAEIGDMVIFNSSKIWHSVSNIQGQKSRITFGGFLAKSKHENKVFYFG